MGKNAYVGVSSIAKKVKNVYVGVGGVAKKVKKAYIGVGGVAKLWWSGENKTIGVIGKTSTSSASTVAYIYGSDDNGQTFTQRMTLTVTGSSKPIICYSARIGRWIIVADKKYVTSGSELSGTLTDISSVLGSAYTWMYDNVFYNTNDGNLYELQADLTRSASIAPVPLPEPTGAWQYNFMYFASSLSFNGSSTYLITTQKVGEAGGTTNDILYRTECDASATVKTDTMGYTGNPGSLMFSDTYYTGNGFRVIYRDSSNQFGYAWNATNTTTKLSGGNMTNLARLGNYIYFITATSFYRFPLTNTAPTLLSVTPSEVTDVGRLLTSDGVYLYNINKNQVQQRWKTGDSAWTALPNLPRTLAVVKSIACPFTNGTY